MNHVDFLGNIYYEKKLIRCGFLYGSESLNTLSGYSHRKVVVMGTGENSFLCASLLKERHVEVYAYCSNEATLVGKEFLGKKILSPFDVFPNKNYYLIVAIDDPILDPVADQLTHNGVENRAYFFCHNTSIDFKDASRRDLILTAVNCLINNEYDLRIHKNAPLGITLRLMPGLEWWSDEFYWLCEDLKNLPSQFKVLDIGPGFGFLSLIIKLLRPDCKMDWLCLSLEEKVEDSFIDMRNNLYPIKKRFGLIENPAFDLDEKYDVIIMTEVFEHFAAKPVPTLKKIGNFLSESGRIYLSTANWEKANMYRSWKDIPEFPKDKNIYYIKNKSRIEWMDLNLKHTYLYEEPELREVIDQSGLKPERFTLNPCSNFNTVLVKK